MVDRGGEDSPVLPSPCWWAVWGNFLKPLRKARVKQTFRLQYAVCGQQQLSGVWYLISSTFRLDLQKVGPAETSPWRWEDRSAGNPDRHIKGVRRVYFCRGVATRSLWTCSTCICSPSSLKWRTGRGDFPQRRRYLGEEQVVFKWLCGIIDQFDQFWHNVITGASWI